LGANAFADFEASLQEPAPVSLRINRKKLDKSPALESVPWCETGYYLPERPAFASDPLWHAGAYYVQEASSMMLERAFLSARSICNGPLRVLDMCAAPGGKSTHLASMLREDDVLVSNEVIRSRVPVLYENLTKQGYSNTIITSADSSDFEQLGEVFDVIVVDAPCSGEGLFRKDKQAMQEWNPENVQTCELRQKRILDSISKCLKQGGFLIYSTCTYNPGENEQQIARLLAKGFEKVPFDLNGTTYTEFQAYPHLVKGEGLFISLLQKQYHEGTTTISISPGKNQLKPVRQDAFFKPFIDAQDGLYDFEGQILYIPSQVQEFYRLFISNLYCYAIGTKVGKQKEQLSSLSEYLPFALVFNKGSVMTAELDQASALSYIANQAIPYRHGEKGYMALTYKDVPIGLGKFAGNRINNLFPNEWRLRKSILKEDWFNILG
jgi:16S rRNA C967 or C1407 C5-methylase (RsmB/RsmF family)/NOL1/NOP2/fmu family ribosome biogenesis protein